MEVVERAERRYADIQMQRAAVALLYSAGQRSLVALSLVLAMLKYKPAPLYILDEVDAALDLSHTQNIGAMIKQNFKDSQVSFVSCQQV